MTSDTRDMKHGKTDCHTRFWIQEHPCPEMGWLLFAYFRLFSGFTKTQSRINEHNPLEFDLIVTRSNDLHPVVYNVIF
jgi:hypothetical protein